MNIFELLTTQEIIDYVEQLAPTYNMFSSLFPDITSDKEQLIIEDQYPDYDEPAQPVAGNTEAPISQRPYFSKSIQDFTIFKDSKSLTDTELFKLNTNQALLSQDPALRRVFDDIGSLVRAHEIKNEQMRSQALVTGKLNFKDENNFLNQTIDFKIPTDQFKNFDFEKGDFLEFLYQAKRLISDRTGYGLTRMILSEDIEFKLRRNESIRNAFASYKTDFNRTLTPAELADVIRANTGITYSIPLRADGSVYGYNKSKDSRKRDMVPFIPLDKCILLPGGELGNTFHGVTSEELELRGSGEYSLQKYGGTIITQVHSINPLGLQLLSVSRSTVTYPKAPSSIVVTDQESGPTTFQAVKAASKTKVTKTPTSSSSNE